MTKSNLLRRTYDECGIGGIKCHCCRPGRAHTKKWTRRCKRRERRLFEKYLMEQ